MGTASYCGFARVIVLIFLFPVDALEGFIPAAGGAEGILPSEEDEEPVPTSAAPLHPHQVGAGQEDGPQQQDHPHADQSFEHECYLLAILRAGLAHPQVNVIYLLGNFHDSVVIGHERMLFDLGQITPGPICPNANLLHDVISLYMVRIKSESSETIRKEMLANESMPLTRQLLPRYQTGGSPKRQVPSIRLHARDLLTHTTAFSMRPNHSRLSPM